jgi:sarcosine oxidase, subunit gamma
VTVETFRRSPLDGRADDLARIGGRELAFLTQLSVRTHTPEAFGLPAEPNTWTTLTGGFPREALWLGPDEWLVAGPPGSASGFHHGMWTGLGFDDPVAEGLAGAESVVEVSANRVVIQLARDDAHAPGALLEQGCSLDLDPRSWREGICAQTLLAHVPVILQERGDATRIFVRPSFANWLVDWLLSVAS